MFRIIRSLSCSRVTPIRSILNVHRIPTLHKFHSIESFVNYQANTPNNFQESCLNCLRPFRKAFEVNTLPILKTPRRLTNYIAEKTQALPIEDFQRQPFNNFQTLAMMRSHEDLSPASVSLSALSRPESCPPCEPCSSTSNATLPSNPQKKPSKGGRLVIGLFTLVAKFFIAVGVVCFSGIIGVWDNPSSWTLLQTRWNQFIKDAEDIVIENDSFDYKNRKN